MDSFGACVHEVVDGQLERQVVVFASSERRERTERENARPPASLSEGEGFAGARTALGLVVVVVACKKKKRKSCEQIAYPQLSRCLG